MFPEKFGLDKWNDESKRTFDFIQHKNRYMYYKDA